MLVGPGLIGRQGRQSARGNLAALYLPFASSGGLDSRITFTRASSAWDWVADGSGGVVLKEFASGDERVPVVDPSDGTALGYRAEGSRTNKCTNYSFNPDASLTNISASAGTLDRVNDSANIPFSGQAVGGQAFHLNNGTGGAVTITVTGEVSNTNAHSLRVFCRYTGTAPTLQLTGGDGAVSCNDDYAETKSENVTPSATTDQWQLSVPDGTEVWFVVNGLEEGSFCTTPIETQGSAVTRAADDASMPLPSELADGFVWVVSGRTPSSVDGFENIGNINKDNGKSEELRLQIINTGAVRLVVRSGSSLLLNLDSSVVLPDDEIKIAIRALSGNYSISVNGNAVTNNSITGFPSGLNTKLVGSNVGAPGDWNSTIASDRMYANPQDWTDADLQEASSL